MISQLLEAEIINQVRITINRSLFEPNTAELREIVSYQCEQVVYDCAEHTGESIDVEVVCDDTNNSSNGPHDLTVDVFVKSLDDVQSNWKRLSFSTYVETCLESPKEYHNNGN